MALNKTVGDWKCPRCKSHNVFCDKCASCGCPHPEQACPICTVLNAYNATECDCCQQQFTQTVQIIAALNRSISPPTNLHHNFNINHPSEQVEDDEDDIMDLTQCDDSHTKQVSNSDNANPKATNLSQISTASTLSAEDMNDDENNADFQYALNLSLQSHEQEMRRFSSHFENEHDEIKLNKNDTTNHNKNALFDGYDDLFCGYSNDAQLNSNDDNSDSIEMLDTELCQKRRKRKRKRNDIIESPRKKRKCNDDVHELNEFTDSIHIQSESKNNRESAADPVDSDGFEDVEPETLSKKERNQIEKSYQKFLQYYLKGSYSLRTVCIEYGPKFCGRSSKFHDILSDTEWRPSSFGLPSNVAFECCDNMNLPDFVCRFKHYTLKTDKKLIYRGANIPGEVEKLKGRNIEALASYFFPRLLNKNKTIYDKHAIVRLNYTDFKKLYNGQNLSTLISRVKSLENVESINITLENVAQKITQIQNKRQNEEVMNQNSNRNDANCPFNDAQQLKDKMMEYYFRDKNIRAQYTKNQKETAHYVVRAARTLAENRFKKQRINQLTVSDHNIKGVRGTTSKTNKDIFFSTLVAMHNLSEKQAAAIAAKYPTVGALIREYRKRSARDGELLLENITASFSGRRLGPAVSKRVYHVFYQNTDGDMKMN